MISIKRGLLLVKCSSLEFEVQTWALYQRWMARFIPLSSGFTTCNIVDMWSSSGFVTWFSPTWFVCELYFEGISGGSLKTVAKIQEKKVTFTEWGEKYWWDRGTLNSNGEIAGRDWASRICINAYIHIHSRTQTHKGTEQSCCLMFGMYVFEGYENIHG